MARLTGSDIVWFLRKAMGMPTEDEWSDANILRFWNLAQNEIAMERNIPELETSTTITTVADTAEYELSVSDVLKINQDAVNTTDGYRIKYSNRDAYTRSTQGTSTTPGSPTEFFESGLGSNDRKQVTFFPTPDTTGNTITVWYYKIPTEVVVSPNATNSELPQGLESIVLKRAKAMAEEWSLEHGRAAASRKLAREGEMAAYGITPPAAEKRYPVESFMAEHTRRRR